MRAAAGCSVEMRRGRFKQGPVDAVSTQTNASFELCLTSRMSRSLETVLKILEASLSDLAIQNLQGIAGTRSLGSVPSSTAILPELTSLHSLTESPVDVAVTCKDKNCSSRLSLATYLCGRGLKAKEPAKEQHSLFPGVVWRTACVAQGACVEPTLCLRHTSETGRLGWKLFNIVKYFSRCDETLRSTVASCPVFLLIVLPKCQRPSLP